MGVTSFHASRGVFYRRGIMLLACLAIACAVQAAVTLVDEGMAKAVIVANGHQQQATNLQSYLQKISGGLLPVVESRTDAPQGQALIVLELVEAVPGASNKITARQAYRLRVEGNVLTLTAATNIGLHYAVWGLLEDHLGCRFYDHRIAFFRSIGDGFEVVPTRATIQFDRLDDVQEPAFQHRGFVYVGGIDGWSQKNRGGGDPFYGAGGAVTANHNFYSYIDFTNHPEWYPMRKNGQRERDWAFGLCGTNAALAEEMAKNVMAKEMVKWQDPGKPIPLAQGDGFTHCLCDNCRALVQQEESEMAPIMLMLNRVLEITSKVYPKHQVITFSYFDTLKTPKTLKPHDNLWFNVVSSSLSQNHAGDQVGYIRNNPANRDYYNAIMSWPKVAPGRVTIWDWALTSYPLVEWPNILFLPDNVRLWQEAGINDVALQVGFGGNWSWLRNWLFLKMAWNPQVDSEALTRQFLNDYYGSLAGPLLWEYLLAAKTAYEDVKDSYVPSGVRWSYWTNNMQAKMFPPTVLTKMDALLDAAERAAADEENPIYAQHVADARASSTDLLMLHQQRNLGGLSAVVEADNARWLVPAGRADMPARIRRIVDTYSKKNDDSIVVPTEPGVERAISDFTAQYGGEIASMKNEHYAVDVTPGLRGQITSILHLPSGKEILAGDVNEFGYRDMFAGIPGQVWNLRTIDEDKITTGLILSPPYYGYTASHRMPRSVSFSNDGTAIRIDRQYEQDAGAALLSGDNMRFNTRWMLTLPNPSQARVLVRGGGIEQLYDLRYVEAGGQRGMQVGVRFPGMDNMTEFFDDVIAVSDAQIIAVPLTGTEGDVTIQLDRGDGLLAELTLPAAGLEKVELQPVVEKHHLIISLIGTKKTAAGELPPQMMRLRAVPVFENPEEAVDVAPAPAAAAKIRMLENGRAINELDGAELIWVPTGPFLMGSKAGEGSADEQPQRQVTLDGYWIYRYPVTLKQYQQFIETAKREMPPLAWGQDMHADPPADEANYPFHCNWFDADAYAKWAGGMLPSEAQWEKAARGMDGRIYPWGDAWDPEKAVGMEQTIYRFSTGNKPVGSTPAGASPYGVEDMAGNVYEWVHDWYQYDYYQSAPATNPPGPVTGSHKVLRGGDSMWDERFSRSACRMIMPPQVRDWVKTGFRVVIPGVAVP